MLLFDPNIDLNNTVTRLKLFILIQFTILIFQMYLLKILVFFEDEFSIFLCIYLFI